MTSPDREGKSKRGRDFPLQKKGMMRARKKGGFPPKQSGTTERCRCVSRRRGARFLFIRSPLRRLVSPAALRLIPNT